MINSILFQIINSLFDQSNFVQIQNDSVFSVKQNHFVFEGNYFDQVDGVAMGSTLGPVLANIVKCVIWKRMLFMIIILENNHLFTDVTLTHKSIKTFPWKYHFLYVLL